MGEIKFQCPHCKEPIEAPDNMAGLSVDCPSCNKSFQIPTRSASVVSLKSKTVNFSKQTLIIAILSSVIIMLLLFGSVLFIVITRDQPLPPPNGSTTAGPSNESARIAKETYSYWMKLNVLSGEAITKYSNWNYKDCATSAAFQQSANAFATDIRSIAQQIAYLPVLNVDPDLVSFSLKTSAAFRELAQMYEEMGPLVVEMDQFRQNSNSLDSGIEAFVRGMMGDPLGKFNEIKQGETVLEQKSQQLTLRSKQVISELDRLTNEQNLLRVTLSQRYHKEF